MGFVFYECPVCFPNEWVKNIYPITNQSVAELYALTLKQKARIEQLGIKYVCIWEHKFQQALKMDWDILSKLRT